MGYRTNDGESAEMCELRNRLHEAENRLRKYQKRENRRERVVSWWRRNRPSEAFCFWTFLGTILGASVVLVTLGIGSSTDETAQTESRAVQTAVEHFHSSRATARCFVSNEHGMLCELRNGQSKVMARCDTENCWTSL